MTVEESLERISRDIRWMRDTHDLIAMFLYDYCDSPYRRRLKDEPRFQRLMQRLREEG